MDATELLDEFDRLSIELWATGERLQFRAPRGTMTPELRLTIAEHRRDLLQELALRESRFDSCAPDRHVRLLRPPPVIEWDEALAALADFILLLTPCDLPESPFPLAPGCTVVDGRKYLAKLKLDLKAGPKSPRARYGALQDEMRSLHSLLFLIQP